jgi:hypothetical protein
MEPSSHQIIWNHRCGLEAAPENREAKARRKKERQEEKMENLASALELHELKYATNRNRMISI